MTAEINQLRCDIDLKCKIIKSKRLKKHSKELVKKLKLEVCH